MPYYDASGSLVFPVVGLTPTEASEIESEGKSAGQPTHASLANVSQEELEGIRDGLGAPLDADVKVDKGAGRKVGLQGTPEGGRVIIAGSSKRKAEVDKVVERNGDDIVKEAKKATRLSKRELIVSEVDDDGQARADIRGSNAALSGAFIKVGASFSAPGSRCTLSFITWSATDQHYWGTTAGHCMMNANGTPAVQQKVYWLPTANSSTLGREMVWNAGVNFYRYGSANSTQAGTDVMGWWLFYPSAQFYPYELWNGAARVVVSASSWRTIRGRRTNSADLIPGVNVCHVGSGTQYYGSVGELCAGLNTFDTTITELSEFGNWVTWRNVYCSSANAYAGDSGAPVYWRWPAPYAGNAESTGELIYGGFGGSCFQTMEKIEATTNTQTVTNAA
jgi:hypothetical protein